jgi:hypothetical protein
MEAQQYAKPECKRRTGAGTDHTVYVSILLLEQPSRLVCCSILDATYDGHVRV